MWLYAYAPHLYLQSHHGSLFQQGPLALVNTQHHTLQDINPSAYDAGLREGMNIPTASSLSPDCQFVHYDELAMHDAQQQLAAHAMNLASWVSLDEESKAGIYLEIASMRKLMGLPYEMANKFKSLLPHLTLSISSAPNAKAAKLLAMSGQEQHLAPNSLQDYLSQQKLSALTFSPRLELAFKKLGLKKLGQLFKLSPQDVAYRIDKDLAKELMQIIGKADFLPKPHKPEPIFFKQIELQKEAQHHQQLTFPIKALLKDFCNYMEQHSLTSQVLHIEGIDREHVSYPLFFKLARSTQSFQTWFAYAQKRLENFRPTEPVLQLRASCNRFMPFTAITQGLFAGQQQESQDLQQLINQLATRIPEYNLGFAHIENQHAPESQTQFHSFPQKQLQKSIKAEVGQSLWATGFLNKPKIVNHKQYKFIFGPHRLKSLWWQPQHVIRDYYLAQHKQGALHWLFKDLTQTWYLHGYVS